MTNSVKETVKKKKLIKTGFFYFDYLTSKIDKINSDNNEILVAPSWNKNKKNFINEDFEKTTLDSASFDKLKFDYCFRS